MMGVEEGEPCPRSPREAGALGVQASPLAQGESRAGQLPGGLREKGVATRCRSPHTEHQTQTASKVEVVPA